VLQKISPDCALRSGHIPSVYWFTQMGTEHAMIVEIDGVGKLVSSGIVTLVHQHLHILVVYIIFGTKQWSKITFTCMSILYTSYMYINQYEQCVHCIHKTVIIYESAAEN
jgi:hypothetical protein